MATTPKLSSATANFASTYKYKIAGKTDLLFQQVGSLFGKDQLKFSLFKSKRYNETVAQSQIAANPNLSDSEKKIASAERKTLFLGDATRALTQNTNAKSNPRSIANAINQIVKELQAAVNGYIAGRGGETSAVSGGEDGGVTVEISGEGAAASGGYDAEQDQNFINRTETMLRQLKTLLLKQKGPLRMMGKYFDVNYYQADRRLGEITQALNDFTTGATAPAAGATAPADAGSETGNGAGGAGDEPQTPPQQQSLDITV
jgi:hypothetical protein